MQTFFGDSKPVNTVTHGEATFEMPLRSILRLILKR
jgi:hypothetical protein